MNAMYVGDFRGPRSSPWMGQIAPLVPTPRDQMPGQQGAGGGGAPPVHAAPGEAPYTVPIVGVQVPGKIYGIPAQTVVIGGAVILGGIILMKIL